MSEPAPHVVTVYSTDYCPFCVHAKSLLEARQIPYVEINVEHDHERRAWLVQTSGQRTVPQIFIGTESIGGFTELRALDRAGQLAVKVQSALERSAGS